MSTKQRKAERIMISLPPDMLELMDYLQKELMYPTRSALLQEGIRRIATDFSKSPTEKNADASSQPEKISPMEEAQVEEKEKISETHEPQQVKEENTINI